MGYQSIQGATVVGLVCSDGVVLAAEKRVSWGRMVMSRSGKKVFQVTPGIGLAFAGLVFHSQAASIGGSLCLHCAYECTIGA